MFLLGLLSWALLDEPDAYGSSLGLVMSMVWAVSVIEPGNRLKS